MTDFLRHVFPVTRFVLLLGLATSLALHAQEVRKIRDTGPNANRVNVVLLGDGYTAAESAKFYTDAQAKLDVLTTDDSFAPFKDVVNGFAIFVASNQSGSDIPSQGITRDTYFHTSFGISGVDRLLAIDNNTGRTRLNALLAQFTPEYDIVILLVNSTQYGGSGGFPATTSLHSDSNDVMLHEIGHSFANLEDEYEDAQSAPSFPPREGINATQKTDRTQIPWRSFILPTTPVPTTFASADANFVGSFEGSYYRATGFYRPTYSSKMRALGAPWGPVNIRAFSTALQRLNLNNATASATVAMQPLSQTQSAGSPVTLSTAAAGVGPFTYQWMRDGVYIPGATAATYTIAALSAATAGEYRVEITNARGTVSSNPATLTAVAGDARLFALSCRAVVGAGSDVLIPGIAVGGSGQRRVIVRAKGPSILGVSNTLAQPRLQLFNANTGIKIAENTGWDTGDNANDAALRAAFLQTGLPEFANGAADSALLADLDAGSAYTAVISGVNNTSGVALVEVYELGSTGARMIALSCRARVGTGDAVLIPGIAIVGTQNKQLIIRASGPALAAQGVGGTLAQLRLQLFNANGVKIAENTGWSTASNQGEIFATTPLCGLVNFPANSADCAILVTLPPGGYTAQVSGLNNTTGVALIEVYEVP